MEWIVDNVSPIVETRKTDLQIKRAGAVAYSEPRIIWIKMLHRPEKEKLMQLRKKFNEILEETLASHRYTYIMDLDSCLTKSHFDHSNRLNADGKIAFWRHIDDQLKKFDRQEISLKPEKVEKV